MTKKKTFKDKNEYLYFEKNQSEKDAAVISWWFNDHIGYYEGIVYNEGRKQIGDFRFGSWETMEKEFPNIQFNYGD